MSSKYCPICGGTGVKLDGTPCGCRMTTELFTSDLVSLDIPEQYQEVKFMRDAVDPKMGKEYADYLMYLWSDIIALKLRNKNILICSPKGTSKAIMAYSAITELFRGGVPTFPIYDLLEIRRMTVDMDLGRKSKYTQDNPEDMLKVPYLFVKIPEFSTNEVFNTLSILLDRRTRRNGCTIFLFEGSMKRLQDLDYWHTVESLKGDGSYGTLDCREFWRKGESNEQSGS